MTQDPELLEIYGKLKARGLTLYRAAEYTSLPAAQSPRVYSTAIADDYTEMTDTAISMHADADTQVSLHALHFNPLGNIEDGIRLAWERAAELQQLANAEPDDDEREALAREAAAIRETLRTIFNA